MRKHIHLLLGIICLMFASGCGNEFPRFFSADSNPRTSRVLIISPAEGQAFLDASFEKFALNPPIGSSPSRDISFAPILPPDKDGISHFGAFFVWHGQNDHITAFWWSAHGKLRHVTVDSKNNNPLSAIWINSRIIHFQSGDQSRTIRLNEDDSSEYTEL